MGMRSSAAPEAGEQKRACLKSHGRVKELSPGRPLLAGFDLTTIGRF